MDKKYKFYLEAALEPVKETVALRKEVASVIDLPEESERQPDLSYFSSIFVSAGTNLNNAHFLTSELVIAEGTIVSKAVDIEHQEDQIIGHIYNKTFVDSKGKVYSVEDLKNEPIESLDQKDLHIAIGSVIYKTRFPELSHQISEGKWKVSMEAFYQDFDIKIGDLIVSKDEAAALGLDVFSEASYGKQAKVVKAEKVVAEGTVAKVLRGICFSGVGIVKNPANPPSVVLEATANNDDTLVLSYDTNENASKSKEKDNNNNVTSSKVGQKPSVKTEEKLKEESELQDTTTVGVCVNYKKELLDSIVKDQDTKVLETEWCTKYDMSCPVFGDYTDPNCLAKTITAMTQQMVEDEMNNMQMHSNIQTLTDNLLKVLNKN